MSQSLSIALAMSLLCLWGRSSVFAESPWIVYEPPAGSSIGKSIVLVSGDEEYRSEETIPALGKILAAHHGFRCTVLFAVDPKTGEIDPNRQDNIPGLEALDTADLLILFTRFRNLPDEQMKHIVDYVESGRPIIGLRTATHAFRIPGKRKYARYDFRSKSWEGGFGRQVLGETWIAHHGHHGHESTRGIVSPSAKDHPIVSGIENGDIWGPTDVYRVRLPLPKTCRPLILGQVLTGMKPSDPPVTGRKNDPMMPIAWTNEYVAPNGRKARIVTTTMGAAQDFSSEGLRRLLVNATFWALGMEKRITPGLEVELVGRFHALPFGNNRFRKGVRPSDHAWKASSETRQAE